MPKQPEVSQTTPSGTICERVLTDYAQLPPPLQLLQRVFAAQVREIRHGPNDSS